MSGFAGTTKDSSRRKYPGTGGRRHNPVRIKDRREEAKGRNEAWAALPDEQKLAVLRARESRGLGSSERQVARIRARMAMAEQAPKASPAADSGAQDQAHKKTKAKERRAKERKGG